MVKRPPPLFRNGNDATLRAMSEANSRTIAERAQRHRNGVAKKLDVLLAEVTTLRRQVERLSSCPIADLADQRRRANQAIAGAFNREPRP
jgi:hypothetical protein